MYQYCRIIHSFRITTRCTELHNAYWYRDWSWRFRDSIVYHTT